MKKNKLVWRLSTKPTVDEVIRLLESKIITTEEAKELLLREEEDIPTDQLKEIKDELKLLRELVLAKIGQKEVQIIEHHYKDYWPKTTWYTMGSSIPLNRTYTVSKSGDNWTNNYISAMNLCKNLTDDSNNGTVTFNI